MKTGVRDATNGTLVALFIARGRNPNDSGRRTGIAGADLLTVIDGGNAAGDRAVDTRCQVVDTLPGSFDTARSAQSCCARGSHFVGAQILVVQTFQPAADLV